MSNENPASILFDQDGNPVTVELDDADGSYRLFVESKGVVVPPTPPAGSVAFIYTGSNPLAVTSNDASFTIPSGSTVNIQTVFVGCEVAVGLQGTKVELLYDDGTERLFDRFYVNGETLFFSYRDVQEARDGTVMIGNGTNVFIVRREALAGTSREIDCVVRGYYT